MVPTPKSKDQPRSRTNPETPKARSVRGETIKPKRQPCSADGEDDDFEKNLTPRQKEKLLQKVSRFEKRARTRAAVSASKDPLSVSQNKIRRTENKTDTTSPTFPLEPSDTASGKPNGNVNNIQSTARPFTCDMSTQTDGTNGSDIYSSLSVLFQALCTQNKLQGSLFMEGIGKIEINVDNMSPSGSGENKESQTSFLAESSKCEHPSSESPDKTFMEPTNSTAFGDDGNGRNAQFSTPPIKELSWREKISCIKHMSPDNSAANKANQRDCARYLSINTETNICDQQKGDLSPSSALNDPTTPDFDVSNVHIEISEDPVVADKNKVPEVSHNNERAIVDAEKENVLSQQSYIVNSDDEGNTPPFAENSGTEVDKQLNTSICSNSSIDNSSASSTSSTPSSHKYGRKQPSFLKL